MAGGLVKAMLQMEDACSAVKAQRTLGTQMYSTRAQQATGPMSQIIANAGTRRPRSVEQSGKQSRGRCVGRAGRRGRQAPLAIEGIVGTAHRQNRQASAPTQTAPPYGRCRKTYAHRSPTVGRRWREPRSSANQGMPRVEMQPNQAALKGYGRTDRQR